jgi:protein-S-isoprenylcysteine O-methyltransferase Ste14
VFFKEDFKMKTTFKKIAAASVALASVPAFAVGPDLSSLTSSVDMGTTVTAVLAVSAALALLFVATRGAKTVLGMIRGG